MIMKSIEQIQLTRIGTTVLADVFPLAEAKAGVTANMDGLRMCTDAHDGFPLRV